MRAAAIVARRNRWLAAATLAGFGLVALASRAQPRSAAAGLAGQRPSAARTPSATVRPQNDRFSNVRPPARQHLRLPWSLVELILTATVLLALIGLAMALWPRMPALLWRRRRPPRRFRRPVEPAPDDLARRVSQTLRTATSQLAEGQIRNGILLCWHRLEQAAGAAGLAPSAADTSTDLVTRLLAVLPLSREPLDRLAALYREARFSTHPLGDAAVAQARADLAQLRSELAGGPGLSPVTEPQPQQQQQPHDGPISGRLP